VVDSVERRCQIGVEDPPAVRVAARYRAEDRLDRIVAAAVQDSAGAPVDTPEAGR